MDTGNDRVKTCFDTMNRMSEIYEHVHDLENAEMILRKTGKLNIIDMLTFLIHFCHNL